jgi:hypothetical protein
VHVHVVPLGHGLGRLLPVADVHELAHPPGVRRIAVAVELVESPTGFPLATRNHDGQDVPNIGLVVQSEANFFGRLLDSPPPPGKVLAVRKRGQGKEMRYEFRRMGKGIGR